MMLLNFSGIIIFFFIYYKIKLEHMSHRGGSRMGGSRGRNFSPGRGHSMNPGRGRSMNPRRHGHPNRWRRRHNYGHNYFYTNVGGRYPQYYNYPYAPSYYTNVTNCPTACVNCNNVDIFGNQYCSCDCGVNYWTF